jgi:hypothetical protein
VGTTVYVPGLSLGRRFAVARVRCAARADLIVASSPFGAKAQRALVAALGTKDAFQREGNYERI